MIKNKTNNNQISIFDCLYEPFKIENKVRLIELFAGIGAQAKALERLGVDFEHYKVIEIDRFAIKSYNAIHGTNFETSDITKIKSADLEIVDTDKFTYIMTYSFPCTDISLVGLMKGMKKGYGTRSGLLWEVERIISELNHKPQVLLMENVDQVHNNKNISDFKLWIDFLESLGYSNYYQDLNAKDYGIPQNRNRCFMVSILGNYNYSFPKPFKLEKRLKDMLEKEVDEKYFLSKKMLDYLTVNNKINESKGNGFIWKPKQENDIANCLRANVAISSTDNTVCVKQIGNCVKSNSRENPNAGRIYDDKYISPCLTAIGGGNRQPFIFDKNVINKFAIRKLTPLEFFRLMGFDDEDFRKAKSVNSDSQLYKQAGNSIVVDVLCYIFKQLF